MWKQILTIVIAAAAGALAYWLVSPLFIDREVNDELPPRTIPEETATSADQATDADVRTDDTDAIQETDTATESPTLPADGLYPIVATPNHPATGNIRIALSPGEQIVRYEDYDGTNGPDLHVYLANDLEANDYVDLGPARANKGNINYSVPMDIDIEAYQYVLTWCEAFGVLFDYAEIN